MKAIRKVEKNVKLHEALFADCPPQDLKCRLFMLLFYQRKQKRNEKRMRRAYRNHCVAR